MQRPYCGLLKRKPLSKSKVGASCSHIRGQDARTTIFSPFTLYIICPKYPVLLGFLRQPNLQSFTSAFLTYN